MAKLFLSHASIDKPTVRRLANALRSAGHDCWLDEEQILTGESITAAVERGLRESDFVVMCLSKAAVQSGWFMAEGDATMMQQFSSRRDRILPVRLEAVAPPLLISPRAYVDLFPDDAAFDRGVKRLLHSIEEQSARLGSPRVATSMPSTPREQVTTTASTEPHATEASNTRQQRLAEGLPAALAPLGGFAGVIALGHEWAAGLSADDQRDVLIRLTRLEQIQRDQSLFGVTPERQAQTAELLYELDRHFYKLLGSSLLEQYFAGRM